MRTLPTQLLTTGIAALGGGLLALLHVPLAWMIGAMMATAALAWHRPVAVPGWARPAGLVFLGLGLGATFSGPVLAAVTGALPVLLAGGVIAIATGFVVARLFTRLAGTDLQTAFFCAVPGGVIVMAMLAQDAKASVATVTLAQTMRVLVVVLTFPPLLGWLAPYGAFGEFMAPRQPIWWPGLLGMAAAGLALAPVAAARHRQSLDAGALRPGDRPGGDGPPYSGVPVALINAAQVAMGASLGTRLTKSFLLSSRRLAIAAVISSIVLSLLLALIAWGIAVAAGMPVPALILGMAPGGMPEMALTAKALELAVPLVLGFHLTRTVLCNLLVGPLHRAGLRLGLL